MTDRNRKNRHQRGKTYQARGRNFKRVGKKGLVKKKQFRTKGKET